MITKWKTGLPIALVVAFLVALSLYGCTDSHKGLPDISDSESMVETESTVSADGDEGTNIIPTYNHVEIELFWTEFREAIPAGNYAEIQKYVDFPLQTRGPYDEDPIIEVSPEEFEEVFSKFLHENNGGTVIESNMDWIVRNVMPVMKGGSEYDEFEDINGHTDLVRLEDKEAYFDLMTFRIDKNGYWKLSLIYSLVKH